MCKSSCKYWMTTRWHAWKSVMKKDWAKAVTSQKKVRISRWKPLNFSTEKAVIHSCTMVRTMPLADEPSERWTQFAFLIICAVQLSTEHKLCLRLDQQFAFLIICAVQLSTEHKLCLRLDQQFAFLIICAVQLSTEHKLCLRLDQQAVRLGCCY